MDSVATLDENFRALLAEFTAGDPMRQGVLWTNLSRREISRRLAEMGTPASRHVVRKLLKKHGLGQRKACKKKSMGAQRRVYAPEHQHGDEPIVLRLYCALVGTARQPSLP